MDEADKRRKEKLKALGEKYAHFAHPKKEILIGLELSLGNITEATKNAKVARRSYYNYFEEDPEFKLAAEDIIEGEIDWIESKAKQRIQEGSDTMIIFYLKTKGKKRGFIEKTEVVNSTPQSEEKKEILFPDGTSIEL